LPTQRKPRPRPDPLGRGRSHPRSTSNPSTLATSSHVFRLAYALGHVIPDVLDRCPTQLLMLARVPAGELHQSGEDFTARLGAFVGHNSTLDEIERALRCRNSRAAAACRAWCGTRVARRPRRVLGHSTGPRSESPFMRDQPVAPSDHKSKDASASGNQSVSETSPSTDLKITVYGIFGNRHVGRSIDVQVMDQPTHQALRDVGVGGGGAAGFGMCIPDMRFRLRRIRPRAAECASIVRCGPARCGSMPSDVTSLGRMIPASNRRYCSDAPSTGPAAGGTVRQARGRLPHPSGAGRKSLESS
jgi:hypothetical protein